jgi:hypothetical protein
MVHLDPRCEGVMVPGELGQGAVLRLKLSWHYAHSLHLDEEGVVQTLTFPSGSFRCAIPWESIFAMGPADAQPTWVWPSSLPPEMRELLESATLPDDDAPTPLQAAPDPRDAGRPQPLPQPLPQPRAKAQPKLAPAPAFTVLPDEQPHQRDGAQEAGAAAAAAESPSDEPNGDDPPGSGNDDPGTIRRGHLRLVK